MQVINTFYYKNKSLGIKSPKVNILSHNTMRAFFSGTDSSTLSKEGALRNHFVSLIVNNAGVYVARITRQETVQTRVLSYKTFGDVEIPLKQDSIQTTNRIVYYDLNVIIEPNEWDFREEVAAYNKLKPSASSGSPYYGKGYSGYNSTYSNYYSKPKEEPVKPKENTQTLFTDDDEFVDVDKYFTDDQPIPTEIELDAYVRDLITFGDPEYINYTADNETYCQYEMETLGDELFPTANDFNKYLTKVLEDSEYYIVMKGDVQASVKDIYDALDKLPANKYLNKLKKSFE